MCAAAVVQTKRATSTFVGHIPFMDQHMDFQWWLLGAELVVLPGQCIKGVDEGLETYPGCGQTCYNVLAGLLWPAATCGVVLCFCAVLLEIKSSASVFSGRPADIRMCTLSQKVVGP
jgi:hypothetical protein